MTITTGDPLPEVTLTTPEGAPLALAQAGGAPLVVYWYPKADTAGCTREAQEFGAAAGAFTDLGVRVLGVSKDRPAKLRRFIDKHGLTVPLAADETGAAAEAFGVWGEKMLYGRRYMGLERATFLFDRGGRLAEAWRKVRVPGHVERVLAAARLLA